MKICIALAIPFVVAIGSSADAASFVVNSTLDAVDAAPNNGVCATVGNLCTLRAAIQESNANATADTIQVPAGVYTLTIAGSDDFAAMGDLDLRTEITIQGAGADQTIIDANHIDRVFHMPYVPSAPPVTIEDVTIQRGAVTNAQGGGLFHGNAATLLLRGIVFAENHVAGSTSDAIGGGVAINGGGNVTIEGCTLAGNSADRGGAIFNNSALDIQVTTIEGNSARAGGALELYGLTIIQQSTIAANEATAGNVIDVSANDTTLRNSTVANNLGTGAAIAVYDTSGLLLERSTVDGNATDGTIRGNGASQTDLFGSVIAGSTSGAECDTSGGTVTSLGFNFDDDGSCTTQASDITAADPKLGPLADNGGSTYTRAPLFGSLLIDGGDGFPSCSGTDQRGVLRPMDGGGDPTALCDIGAVELAPEPASVAGGLAALGALALRRRF